MGSGGVAIAALPTVIYLEVPFSDGLGGGNSCYCRSHKMAGAIIEHVITQILLHSGCKNIKKIYTAVTFYNFFCREVGRSEVNSLYSTVNREFIVRSLRVIMNWGVRGWNETRTMKK